MITVHCPECGSFVDDVHEDELPMKFDCEVCGQAFLQDTEDEENYD